ncbi:PAS domain S-box protein [Bacillus sp. EB01]|uniref:PAS domain S-box protein n=1 Tax=Bacillus sp. EB01 TaxID=1347086 RepID=UPI0006940582|nr:PAS domain S-box protein [Bacillus sp. EB01]
MNEIWFIVIICILIVLLIVISSSMGKLKEQNRSLCQTLKKAEENKDETALLVEHLPDPYLIINSHSRIVYANRAMLTGLGMQNSDEIIGKSVFDFILSPSKSEVHNRIERVFSGERLKSITFKVKTGTAKLIEYEITTAPIQYLGESCVIIAARDATGKKQIEQELFQTREQLQDLLAYVDAAIWIRDSKTGELVVSLGMENIFGYSEEAFQNRALLRDEIIHPEDIEFVKEKVKAFGHNPIKFDYRIIKNKTEVRWLHLSSTPILGENGDTPKMMGILVDITDVKQTEEKLKESEEHYRILQESLDHFSKDLSKVMKISDLESRLILELQEILGLQEGIHILEIDDRLNLYRCTGGSADLHEAVLQDFDETAQIGSIVEFEMGWIIKIGEIHERIIVLSIEKSKAATSIYDKKIWLQTISRYVSVLYENLYTLEEMIKELERKTKDKLAPRWIMRLLFLLAEKERARLSADLHDSVLQNQILWYRKLQSLRSEWDIPGDLEDELYTIEEGMLDVIRQIRVTCNNLRPPYLNEVGLIKALETLFSQTERDVQFVIEFDHTGLHHDLNEEEMITIYRVAQELLANARKHSNATKVEFCISSIDRTVYFSYSDNGVGMKFENLVDSFDHIGLSGIKRRVDSINGEIELYSSPGKGVNLLISIPIGNIKV